MLNKTLTKLNSYYEDFEQRATKSFYDVLNYEFEPEYYIDGDILTVPISGSEERIDVPRDLLNALEQIVENMLKSAKNPHYADGLKKELNNIAKEIEKMQKAGNDTSKSQDVFSQNSSGSQYLSIPLPVFFKPERFKAYFRRGSETRRNEEETRVDTLSLNPPYISLT